MQTSRMELNRRWWTERLRHYKAEGVMIHCATHPTIKHSSPEFNWPDPTKVTSVMSAVLYPNKRTWAFASEAERDTFVDNYPQAVECEVPVF